MHGFLLPPLPQADWVLPSSREALDADSPWNQELRQQLPGLFLRCVCVGREGALAPNRAQCVGGRCSGVRMWASSGRTKVHP